MILTRVQDPQVRANSLTQYGQMIERAKTDLCQVLLTAATHFKEDAQRDLNTYLTDHWNEQHRLDPPQRLSNNMRQMIEQSQQNITDCLQFVYDQKEKFLLEVPTVTTRELLRIL